MTLRIQFDQTVARTACTGIALVLCNGLACSSGNNSTTGETPGTGGTRTAGTLSAKGGSVANTGGTFTNGGASSNTFGQGGGAPTSTGGSAATSAGGSSVRGTGGTTGNTLILTDGGTQSGTGGRSATASTATATGGSTVTATTGGVSSVGGVSSIGGRSTQSSTSTGASSGSGTGGASSTAGATSTSPAFDPCPATGDCKILPLGDSISAGAGAQPGDNGGYRVELFTKATNDTKHITFVGSLMSGPTSVAGKTFPRNHEGHIGWKIDQVSGIATTAQTVTVSGTSYAGALKDMPNVVLLFAGTNDEGYASSEAGASTRLGALIDRIVAALPNALLVVSSIYPFPGCKDTNYTPTQCAANVATYDAAIPGVIKQRVDQGKHVLFVDMSTPPIGALSTDNVHPNATVGYPWMGDTWYGVIKSYLH